MFRATVQATEKTDVAAAVMDLRTKSAAAGLPPMLASVLASQAQEVLRQLVERGAQLASMGSRMQVTRELSGDGYAVTISFQCGDQRRTLFQRLLDVFRSR